MAEALEVDVAHVVSQPESTSRDAECEGLIEELLGVVRDLPAEELRHVVELVRVARGYMATSGR